MADHASIYRLAETVVAALVAAGRTAVTAESCTGGWIAKAMTDVAGSSAAFGYGIVSYSNAAKESLLGVAADTLEGFGAVSEEVVREMAGGALRVSGADLAVAVSGIAGPDGGTADKPVGTVWFAWAVRDGDREAVDAERQRFEGDRERIREMSVVHALEGVLDRIPGASADG